MTARDQRGWPPSPARGRGTGTASRRRRGPDRSDRRAGRCCSCSEPSSAEIWSSVSTSNESGSAPNFSWLASCCALSWVNEPVISALPSEITWLVRGAETTRPSSTIANWFCGSCRLISRSVTSRNSSAPSRSNSRLTAHSPVVSPCEVCCRPDDARGDPRSLDLDRAEDVLGRAGLVAGDEHLVGTSCVPPLRFAGSVQSSAWNSAAISSVIWARSDASVGVGAGVAPESVGAGVADGSVAAGVVAAGSVVAGVVPCANSCGIARPLVLVVGAGALVVAGALVCRRGVVPSWASRRPWACAPSGWRPRSAWRRAARRRGRWGRRPRRRAPGGSASGPTG